MNKWNINKCFMFRLKCSVIEKYEHTHTYQKPCVFSRLLDRVGKWVSSQKVYHLNHLFLLILKNIICKMQFLESETWKNVEFKKKCFGAKKRLFRNVYQLNRRFPLILKNIICKMQFKKSKTWKNLGLRKKNCFGVKK